MQRLLKSIVKVLEVLMVAIITAQATLLIASVFFRYVLGSPILWSDEMVRYLLIWMTFVGTTLAAKDGKHVVVDAIDMALPPKGKEILNVFSDLVVLIFMLVFFYYGIKMTIFQSDSFGETLIWFRYSYVYVSIPIGSAISILYIVLNWFKGKEKSSSTEITQGA